MRHEREEFFLVYLLFAEGRISGSQYGYDAPSIYNLSRRYETEKRVFV